MRPHRLIRSIRLSGTTPGERRDITEAVAAVVWESGAEQGLCHLFAPHRGVGFDICQPGAAGRSERFPEQVTLLVVDRRLFLAAGERIWFCDGEGAPRRRVAVRVERGERPTADAPPG